MTGDTTGRSLRMDDASTRLPVLNPIARGLEARLEIVTQDIDRLGDDTNWRYWALRDELEAITREARARMSRPARPIHLGQLDEALRELQLLKVVGKKAKLRTIADDIAAVVRVAAFDETVPAQNS